MNGRVIKDGSGSCYIIGYGSVDTWAIVLFRSRLFQQNSAEAKVASSGQMIGEDRIGTSLKHWL